MTTVSIIGTGNMGTAIGALVTAGGNELQLVDRDTTSPITGDIVVLAVPHPSVADIVAKHGAELAGRIVVDITNPVDFTTFDSLVVPAGSSFAAQLAEQLPDAKVLKAFNTNFAGTLASKQVGGVPTTVLIAGDDAEAKQTLAAVVRAGGVETVDAGALSRAHELEALGFLQLGLAVQEKVGWGAGFALVAA